MIFYSLIAGALIGLSVQLIVPDLTFFRHVAAAVLLIIGINMISCLSSKR